MNIESTLNTHYGRGDLALTILRALEAAGKNPAALTIDDLAPVDQFHTRGRDATLDLARRANISAAMRVLDLGGGLGGPARTLVSMHACNVTVLDITREFCEVGEMLTERTGLSDRVAFRHGSALDIPFADASFDIVWTQHSSMNIEDKARLYQEVHRVLKPKGRLALQEIMAGAVVPAHYPAPWAEQPTMSFLRAPEEIRNLIRCTGLVEIGWYDETEVARPWYAARAKAMEQGLPPLGIHLILGERFPAMSRNQMRNLEEGRIRIIQAVFERSQP
jgi:SAM-dependent methyltransferase